MLNMGLFWAPSFVQWVAVVLLRVHGPGWLVYAFYHVSVFNPPLSQLCGLGDQGGEEIVAHGLGLITLRKILVQRHTQEH